MFKLSFDQRLSKEAQRTHHPQRQFAPCPESPKSPSDFMHSEGVRQDSSSVIQHEDTEKLWTGLVSLSPCKNDSNKTLNNIQACLGDVGDINKKWSLEGLGCWYSIITLNDSFTSFIQPLSVERLLLARQHAGRHSASPIGQTPCKKIHYVNVKGNSLSSLSLHLHGEHRQY